MPRQPYLKVVPQWRGAKLDIGTNVLRQRPELQMLISDCAVSWPFVEAEMAVLLGHLLKADNAAAIAVFQTLRRSTAQREAIQEAARVALSESDQELVAAVLNVTRSIEAERNALTHGHFGTSTKLPADLIWQPAADYVTFRSVFALQKANWDDDLHQQLLQSLFVYRKKDLEHTLTAIKELTHIWHELISYLRCQTDDPTRASELHHQLCDRPRMREEVDRARRQRTIRSPEASSEQ